MNQTVITLAHIAIVNFGDYTSEVWDTYQGSYYEGEPPFEFCPHCGARIIIDEHRKDDCDN